MSKLKAHGVLLLSMLVLAGCGANPIFMGDEGDGPLFAVRVLEITGDTDLPNVIFNAPRVQVDGCQASVRGTPPKGIVATIRGGRCTVEVTDLSGFGVLDVEDPITEPVP